VPLAFQYSPGILPTSGINPTPPLPLRPLVGSSSSVSSSSSGTASKSTVDAIVVFVSAGAMPAAVCVIIGKLTGRRGGVAAGVTTGVVPAKARGVPAGAGRRKRRFIICSNESENTNGGSRRRVDLLSDDNKREAADTGISNRSSKPSIRLTALSGFIVILIVVQPQLIRFRVQPRRDIPFPP
jgi:hypothetical protein